jgi:hypothetical protein
MNYAVVTTDENFNITSTRDEFATLVEAVAWQAALETAGVEGLDIIDIRSMRFVPLPQIDLAMAA